MLMGVGEGVDGCVGKGVYGKVRWWMGGSVDGRG